MSPKLSPGENTLKPLPMATVNFYLKEPEAKTETLIYLVYYCESFRLKISTGEKILPKNWNSEQQRVKKSYPGYSDFNDFLDKLAEEAKRIPRASLGQGKSVSKDEMKEELLIFLGKDRKQVERGFFEALEEFIAIKKGKLSVNYLKSVTTLKNHIKTFESKRKYKVTFERVNLAFYEHFTSYLYTDCLQTNNTVGTNISRLKHFLKWASRMGYNKFTEYKADEFKAIESETEIIYLTEKELLKLYEHPLPFGSKLYRVREAFCFCCFTGLRFSDVAKIRKENVKGDEIHLTTQKTRDIISIPLNDYSSAILERNDYHLSAISNQKTNSYLKELAIEAELNDLVKLIRFKGSERIESVEPKHDLITSHTARRTFVTLSLEKGMRPETVMAITGHKSYKNFRRYVKLTDKVKKSEMKQIWNNPNKALKVV